MFDSELVTLAVGYSLYFLAIMIPIFLGYLLVTHLRKKKVNPQTQTSGRWSFRHYWGLPWILVSLGLLGYIAYRDFQLIELTFWLLGTLAITPVIAVLVDKVLNPYSTAEYLRQRGHGETSWPVIISQLRRSAILIAIILAIAIGR